jgi:hypothetical protein
MNLNDDSFAISIFLSSYLDFELRVVPQYKFTPEGHLLFPSGKDGLDRKERRERVKLGKL